MYIKYMLWYPPRILVVKKYVLPPQKTSRHRSQHRSQLAVPQAGSSRRSAAKRPCRRLGRHPALRVGRSASAVPESQEPQGATPRRALRVKPGKMEEWMVKQGETRWNNQELENHGKSDYMWLICERNFRTSSLFHQWHGPIPNTADREFTQKDPPKATGPLGWWLSAYICIASHKLSKIDRSHRKSPKPSIFWLRIPVDMRSNCSSSDIPSVAFDVQLHFLRDDWYRGRCRNGRLEVDCDLLFQLQLSLEGNLYSKSVPYQSFPTRMW